jgi:SAM-dependent methyltransferase
MSAPRSDHATRRGIDVNLRSGPQMLEYDAIVHRIRADRPKRILDWGCGHGQVTDLLWQAGLNVTAFDYRPHSAESVQPLARYPHLSAHVSPDPHRLPFDDGVFDAVLSCGVLEHVEDPDASLEEIKRILAPNGTFYIYKLPNRRSYLEAIARRAGLYYHGALEHDRVYDLSMARGLLVLHGFSVTEARYANMLPLTLPGRLARAMAVPIWRVNRGLSAIPGLNRYATNVELVARRAPVPASAPIARGDGFQRSAQRETMRVQREPLRGRTA